MRSKKSTQDQRLTPLLGGAHTLVQKYLSEHQGEVKRLYDFEGQAQCNLPKKGENGKFETLNNVDTAYILDKLFTDYNSTRKLPRDLTLFCIGYLFSSLGINIGKLDVSDELKKMCRSELGRKDLEGKRWEPIHAACERAKVEAMKRWKGAIGRGQKLIQHNKMVETLFQVMPELKEAGVPRGTLLKTLKEAAREFDPDNEHHLIHGDQKKVSP